jgi:hypothetical protein
LQVNPGVDIGDEFLKKRFQQFTGKHSGFRVVSFGVISSAYRCDKNNVILDVKKRSHCVLESPKKLNSA